MANANKRIFYACQAVSIAEEGRSSEVTNYEMVHGLQSVGITTNFNLEQAFELGQIEIYENIEGTPDVEVTLEKVLDGSPLMYHMASSGVHDGSASGLAARAAEKCDLRLGIFPEQFNNLKQGAADAQVEIYCSGMFISSISYSMPVDGNMTESMTLVGNNKQWLTTGQKIGDGSVTEFDGNDFPLSNTGPTASGGVQRREDVMLSGSILPVSIRGVNGSGYSNAINHGGASVLGVASGAPLVHLQSLSISTDFSRDDVLELGRKTPYYRPANFPVEVTCEIEAITTSGDFIFAYEFGDPDLYGTAASGNNLQDEVIFIYTRAGYAFDLGNSNKLSSVSYGGGDAGGGNVSCTYSYSNFNELDVQNRANGYVGFNFLNDGVLDIGAGTFPTNIIGGGQSD